MHGTERVDRCQIFLGAMGGGGGGGGDGGGGGRGGGGPALMS